MKRILCAFLFAVAMLVSITSDASAFFFRRNVTVINNNVVAAAPAVAVPAFSTVAVNSGLGVRAVTFIPNNAVFASSGFVGGVGSRVGVRVGGVRVGVGGFGFRRAGVGVRVGGRVGFHRFR